MEWERLLSVERLAELEKEPEAFGRYPIHPFEQDHQAIITSAAFRRLQDKTQVFPLDQSDFVRTRLTHSIEVSTVARQLGEMVVQNFGQHRSDALGPQVQREIPAVLMCAGLLHDLGNPPFGHFGEALIGEWFREHLSTVAYKGRPLRAWLTEQMARDLEHFEGNAQALRILAKARHGGDLDLTLAVMGALIKYPTDSLSFDREAPEIRRHKLGYFAAEEEVFWQIVDALGMWDGAGEVCRHPLTYLLEAADDIAYATADLEDGLKKELFTLDEFLAFFQAGLGQGAPRTPEDYARRLLQDLEARRGPSPTPEGDAAAFRGWLGLARRWLMYCAVFRFSNSYRDIMAGVFQQDLFWSTNHVLTLQRLKSAMAHYAYDSAGIVRLELAAHSILTFLLDRLVRAVLYWDAGYREEDRGFAPSSVDKKYLRVIPAAYLQDYQAARAGDEGEDLYRRILMVTDFLSGMTDSYARRLYREVSGIE